MRTKLTAVNVKTLPVPEGKSEETYWHTALPAFGLRVRIGGARGYLVQYEFGLIKRKMTLGPIHLLTLSQAMGRAKDVLAAVRLGKDPAAAKLEARRKASETFGSSLDDYLEFKLGGTKPRSFTEISRHLKVHAKPLHPVAIEHPDLRRLIAARLLEIANQNGQGVAGGVRTSISSYCAWLVQTGLLEANPCANIVRAQTAARTHVIGFEEPEPGQAELGRLWNALVAIGDQHSVILRLLLLTLARRDEIADLAWSEVDLERALITLPPERVKRRLNSKNKSPHLIPLVPLAVELLCAQIRRVGADGSERDLVFGTGSNGKGWQNWSRPKAELDATIQPPIRPWRLHDFRRVGSTVMNDEIGIQPWVVEACLGHVVAGVAGVYNKAQYLAERRRALERWCDFVLGLATGKPPAEIVNLHAHMHA